ncbi:two-component system sensor histidine kinase DesK [Micromonospora luteifusca]|uniref:Two-component system sensor histidine kinase DesK n=1 Tax=Micromonospora luteifusca TaxID=709860 RepID=A0ABS2LP49_9ACTN|nr:histidine kinase [Micromonospora luteifusca]MBM7489439.1 two-component system sensor histidine kinase DesK [Micromonospora luteifusca]
MRTGPTASRLARAVVATVVTGLSLVALLNIIEAAQEPRAVVLALVSMGGLLSLQLFFLTDRARRLAGPARLGLLIAQSLLGFLPFLVFGQSWVGMPGFVAGSFLLMLAPPRSVVAFAATVFGTMVIQSAMTTEVLLVAYTTVSTVLTGLIVYGLSQMSILVGELHTTRTELARLAVIRERLRFSRDLHDLLGYSLSAVTLKSELTRRLVVRNPDRALAELDDILGISRQALADVRELASGYRDMSLGDEARSAQSVLAAAGIRVRMEIDHPALPQAVSTVLATVLREGVTNLLRHSRARNCEVLVSEQGGRVLFTIANDGADQGPGLPSEHGGSGLRNLADRAGALGGRLVTCCSPDGWFRLRAELPVSLPAAVEAPAQLAS